MEIIEDRTNKDYWNWRVLKNKDDLPTMIFADPRYPVNTDIAIRTLEGFRECSVMDVCCGYGRLAPLFDKEKYFGFDYAEKMIELAREKYPGYRFAVIDAMNPGELPKAEVVVIFISLGMIQLSPAQFFDRYKEYATKAVICITSTETLVYPIYA
jgi:SAM-dependent methyltransferase